MSSIWRSVECDAWSRGFDYENYISLHEKRKETSTPVDEEAYKLLCHAFNVQMFNAFKEDKVHDLESEHAIL